VQRVANSLLAEPGGQLQPHFLGAVVLQQNQSGAGELQRRTVIDGQQRLTTLQIMLDAIHLQLRHLGFNTAAARLQPLIENAEPFQATEEDKYKIWPTNKDRAAFHDVMGKSADTPYGSLAEPHHKLVRAHQYFADQARLWLEEPGERTKQHRAEALEQVVRERLQLVVIDLTPQENAQEIFETLNARGALLTAADLIKNFIFQRLLEQGTDVERAYETYWKPFETAYWEQEVSSGRTKYQRASLFINQWLIAKTGEEILAREVFTRFKVYADVDTNQNMTQVLESLFAAAKLYRNFHELSLDQSSTISMTGLFAYKLRNMEMDSFRPLVMYLQDPDRPPLDEKTLLRCYSMIESWLVRRLLVRATTKNYNKLVPEIISHLRRSQEPPDLVLERYLKGETADTSYWPDDEELKRELADLPFYRKISKSRARMIFESMEDHLRGWFNQQESKSGTRVRRDFYVLEHIMPRAWQKHWPLPTTLTEFERDRNVNKLGNLTLLSRKLNSSVSNSAWITKKDSFQEHDLLQLNAKLLNQYPTSWSDNDIAARTKKLIETIIEIWPVPVGHKREEASKEQPKTSSVGIVDLLDAGLLFAGQQIHSKPGRYEGRFATILADGRIDYEGQVYETPSGAGQAVRKRVTNGWRFWITDLASSKPLRDVRDEYLASSEISFSEEIEEDEVNDD
jgi:hypothetical protein